MGTGRSLAIVSAVIITLTLMAVSAFAQDWVKASPDKLPAGATPVGYDSKGNGLYLVRAPFKGALTLGRFNPTQPAAGLPWGGAENMVTDFEAYTGAGTWFPWSESQGFAPENAVIGGGTDSAPSYVIRGRAGSDLVPGKFNPKSNTAYIPAGGKEVVVGEYEILLSDWSGNPSGGFLKPFLVGKDPAKEDVFAARATLGTAQVIGRADANAEGGTFIVGGKPVKVTQGLELFVGSGIWVDAANLKLPFGAIKAGTNPDGSALYLVRNTGTGPAQLGRLDPRGKGAYFFDGKSEVLLSKYAVLCYDFTGLISKAPVRSATIADTRANPVTTETPATAAGSTPSAPAGINAVTDPTSLADFMAQLKLAAPVKVKPLGGAMETKGEFTAKDVRLNGHATDVYQMTVPAASMGPDYFITFEWTSKNADATVDLRVFDPQGVPVSASARGPRPAAIAVSTGGTFTFALTDGADKPSGAYTLLARMGEWTREGTTSAKDGKDTLSVYMEAGVGYYVGVSSDTFSPRMELFTPSGESVASTTDGRLEYSASTTGTYRVVIGSKDPKPAGKAYSFSFARLVSDDGGH